MSHKVHPKIYRIGTTTDWSSRWLVKNKFRNYLEEDFYIRNFLNERLKNCGVDNIEIERFVDKINIIISSSRPGLIIGRDGAGITEIKKQVEKKLNLLKKKYSKKASPQQAFLNIEIREIKNPWTSAALVSQWIASQIERRIPYRKALKQALEKIMANKEIKGARVEVAGRLNGTEIARDEWLKIGRLPRQTLRADIDYGISRAYCTYGVIGIKVWIYKGEKFIEKTSKV